MRCGRKERFGSGGPDKLSSSSTKGDLELLTQPLSCQRQEGPVEASSTRTMSPDWRVPTDEHPSKTMPKSARVGWCLQAGWSPGSPGVWTKFMHRFSTGPFSKTPKTQLLVRRTPVLTEGLGVIWLILTYSGGSRRRPVKLLRRREGYSTRQGPAEIFWACSAKILEARVVPTRRGACSSPIPPEASYRIRLFDYCFEAPAKRHKCRTFGGASGVVALFMQPDSVLSSLNVQNMPPGSCAMVIPWASLFL